MFISIVASIGIVQSLFLIMLIQGKHYLHNKILIAWLTFMALHLGFYMFNFNEWLSDWPSIHILGFSLLLIHAPLFYLYCLALTRTEKMPKYYYLHFLPYILYNSILISYHHLTDLTILPQIGFLYFEGSYPPWLNAYGTPLALTGCLYPLASVYIIHQHQTLIRTNYSFEDEIKLKWLMNWSIAASSFFIFVYLAIYMGLNYSWFKTEWVFQIVSLFLTLYIFFIGFNGLSKTRIFTVLNPSNYPDISTSTQYDKTGLDQNKEIEIANTLKAHMEKDKPFLDEHLTLSQLADQIAVSRNHLSQTINSHYAKNFFDYVNEYRVKEVQNKLTDQKNERYSILGIGLSCGFKSKSSFNKAFRKVTGQTPSEFLRSIQE